jgi:hypothetical protein
VRWYAFMIWLGVRGSGPYDAAAGPSAVAGSLAAERTMNCGCATHSSVVCAFTENAIPGKLTIKMSMAKTMMVLALFPNNLDNKVRSYRNFYLFSLFKVSRIWTLPNLGSSNLTARSLGRQAALKAKTIAINFQFFLFQPNSSGKKSFLKKNRTFHLFFYPFQMKNGA